jgi:hypothetical protein
MTQRKPKPRYIRDSAAFSAADHDWYAQRRNCHMAHFGARSVSNAGGQPSFLSTGQPSALPRKLTCRPTRPPALLPAAR